MVAKVKRTYRTTLLRFLSLWVLCVAFLLRPGNLFAQTAEENSQAFSSVFNAGATVEEIRASNKFASCYGQAYYYGQGYYYSQATYGTVLTTSGRVTGDATVTGAVSKGSGTFVIDHPLDPKNKLLYHSFLESPDAKNIYDGVVTLDKYGEAFIELPDYFLALNTDYRYLATPISGPMPNLHLDRSVRREWFIGKPSFRISGGEPNGEISWQVSGIRQDPLILLHPIITEVEKAIDTVVPKGECLFEPLCE